MPFTSPFGAGYGLGQVAAGVGEGLLRGKLEAPVLQRENLQNQQLGLEVQGQQALNQALSQPVEGEVPQGQQITPYDNQLLRMNSAASQLEKNGQGLQAAHLRQQSVSLAQQQHTFALGRAAQTLLGPNPMAAVPYIKAAGLGDAKKIDTDQDGNIIITGQDGHQQTLSRFQVAQIAADPDRLAQSMMMNAYYTGRIQNQGRSLDIKENQNQMSNQLRQMSIEQRREASQNMLQGRLGAANINAATRKYIFDNGPNQKAFMDLTAPAEQGGQGLSDSQAVQVLDQARMAGANAVAQHNQSIQNFIKANPGSTAQQALDYANQIAGGQAATAPKAAPRPVTPRAATPQPINPNDPNADMMGLIGKGTQQKDGVYQMGRPNGKGQIKVTVRGGKISEVSPL